MLTLSPCAHGRHARLPAVNDCVRGARASQAMRLSVAASRSAATGPSWSMSRHGRMVPRLPASGSVTTAPIVPADLGTKGGIVTDERARALRADGSVIDGLYAAGNASSAVMGHTYAGPGATIGPALVFGDLAARDIAVRCGGR